MSTSSPKPLSPQKALELYTDGAYLDQNPTWGVEDSAWKATQIKNILINNGVLPKTVCEVGCGAGEIVRQLSLSFPTTQFAGYEVSPQAFELCQQRISPQIQFHLKNLCDEDVLFDCLLCIDVFEHVEDYFGFIRALKDKAEFKIFYIPLDISVLSVLRSSMMARRLDVGHLHYFSKETALATLQDCGYEIIKSVYTTPFKDIPAKKFETKLARLPRKLLHKISPDWSARLLGGSSLLVLAK
jgi:hypothetical protein